MANETVALSSLSPYQVQSQELDRRQKLAELMQQQSYQDIQPGSYNGMQAPISPVQGLAKMLQMGLNGYQQKKLTDERKELSDQYQADRKGDMSDILAALKGTPAKAEVPGMVSATPADIEDRQFGIDQGTGAAPMSMGQQLPTMGGMGEGANVGLPAQAAVPGGAAAMYQAMMNAKTPGFAEMGLQGEAARQAAADARLLKLQDDATEQANKVLLKGVATYGDLNMTPAQREANRLAQQRFESEQRGRDAVNAIQQARFALAEREAAYNGVPAAGGAPVAPVGPSAAPGQPTMPQGAPAPTAAPAGPMPAPVPGLSPKDQAARTLKAVEANDVKDRAMAGLPDAIKEARAILQPGKGGTEPTGSGLGWLADKTLGLVGASLPGANAAAKLKVIGGKLVSMMPRFEGPQSDKDTQTYKDMAGDVANETLPISQRLAALDSLEKLFVTPSGGAPAAPSVPVRQTSTPPLPPGYVMVPNG